MVPMTSRFPAIGTATSRGTRWSCWGFPSGQTFPASIELGKGSARTVEAAGPAVPGRLGWGLANLGKFYGTNSVLAVSGDYYNGTTFTGAAYAFAGGVNFASPNDSVFGQASDYLGWSIAPIGALGSPMAVAVASPHTFGTGGTLAIHKGTTGTGPFVASPIVISNAAATGTGDMFGSVFSSYVAGVPTATADHKSSFLGDEHPDVAVSGLAEGGLTPKLYFIDGQKVQTTLTSGDVAAVADASRSLPANWTGGLGVLPRSCAIRDLNNDGYADLAIGQYKRSGSYAGEVVVLW